MLDQINGILEIITAVGAIGSVAHSKDDRITQKNKDLFTHDNLNSIKQLEVTRFDKITHKKFNLTTQKSFQPN